MRCAAHREWIQKSVPLRESLFANAFSRSLQLQARKKEECQSSFCIGESDPQRAIESTILNRFADVFG